MKLNFPHNHLPHHPCSRHSRRDAAKVIMIGGQSTDFERDSLYFHFPNYAFHKLNRLGRAIREGNFKLIKYYDDSIELFDLSNDLGEQNNLVSEFPELTQRLVDKLDRWLRDCNAGLPIKSVE